MRLSRKRIPLGSIRSSGGPGLGGWAVSFELVRQMLRRPANANAKIVALLAEDSVLDSG